MTVSQVEFSNAADHSPCGSQVSRASTSSRVSYTRAKQEAEHAALLERAAGLKKKQQVELGMRKLA